jgi:hypothetical protein
MAPTAIQDVDDFGVDDYDNLFASSGDEGAKNDAKNNKRKQSDGLGIEEAVAVKKKARVPNVKLDEARLLSDKGIPKLRAKARELKFKGKGHEVQNPYPQSEGKMLTVSVLRCRAIAFVLSIMA